MTTPTPATRSPGLSQIGQIAVTVHDIDRAIAFYRDTLGMSFLFQAGTLGFFDCGGVRLMLSPPESPEFDHPGVDPLLQGRRHPGGAPGACRARRDLHRRAARDPPHAGPRSLDGVLQGLGGQHARADVRTAEGVMSRRLRVFGSAGQNRPENRS